MKILSAIRLVIILTACMSFSSTSYADWNESDEVSTLQSADSDESMQLNSPDTEAADSVEDEEDDF